MFGFRNIFVCNSQIQNNLMHLSHHQHFFFSNQYLGRKSLNLKMGIVGMANIGKSTTFNLLTNLNVPAENFPFCTIDPNLAIVPVPDPRFENLCKLYEPNKKVASTLSIIDIAGLVKGASEGHGLGNEFLSHIQSVDGIYHIIRGFSDEKILHTEGEMDAFRDLTIIIEELIAKDLQYLNKRLEELKKKLRNNKDRDLIANYELLSKAKDSLKKKISLKNLKWSNEEIEKLNKHLFLTAKPMMYLINLSSEDYEKIIQKEKLNKKFIENIEAWVKKNGGGQIIPYSAEYELKNPKSKHSLIQNIIYSGYKLLNLIHFFTVGSDEVKSWTIRKSMVAEEAAGLIHTDFQKYFVSAEVCSYENLIKYGKDKISRYTKKEGRNYEIKDGDIINFKVKMRK